MDNRHIHCFKPIVAEVEALSIRSLPPVALILGFIVVISLGFSSQLQAQIPERPLLNTLSLLRCTPLGTRLLALEELDFSEDQEDELHDLLDKTQDEINELNRKYRNNYERLEQLFQTAERSRDVENLAREAGEIEGDRTAEFLAFEVELRQLIGTSTHQEYLQILRDELQRDVEDRLDVIVEESARDVQENLLFPNLILDRDPVTFCPALPQR